MKNNKKKGFTLVELLVVIAILAILATVATVGYTAFIESATVSNDENVAAQLNQFLAAVKVDSNGPFYGKDINEDNIMELTQYILDDSDYGDLIPQAAKYGYHFYFDLEKEKYVVIGDKDERILSMSPLSMLFASAAGESTNGHPESCFTEGGRYFLVETGTELSDLVAGFKNITTADGLKEYYAKVSDYKTDAKQSLTSLITLVKKTVFATAEGYLVVEDAGHTVLFVPANLDGVKLSGVKVNVLNNKATTPISSENPLITLGDGYVFNIPKPEMIFGNALWFDGEHYTPDENVKYTTTLKFNLSLEEIKAIVDQNFTNVVFELNDGKQYGFKDGAIVCLTDGTSTEVTSKVGVQSFKIGIEGKTEEGAYSVPFDVAKTETYKMYAYGFVSTDSFNPDNVPDETVTWEIVEDQYTPDNANIDENGVITGVSAGIIRVKAISTVTNTATAEFIINIGAIDGILGIAYANGNGSNSGTIEFDANTGEPDEIINHQINNESNNNFTFTVTPNYYIANITNCDDTFSVVIEGDVQVELDQANNTASVNFTKAGTYTITVAYVAYPEVSRTFTVKVTNVVTGFEVGYKNDSGQTITEKYYVDFNKVNGTTFDMDVFVTTSDGSDNMTGHTVTWSCVGPNGDVTIDTDGKFTVSAAGLYTISATVDGTTKSFTLVVAAPHHVEITFNSNPVPVDSEKVGGVWVADDTFQMGDNNKVALLASVKYDSGINLGDITPVIEVISGDATYENGYLTITKAGDVVVTISVPGYPELTTVFTVEARNKVTGLDLTVNNTTNSVEKIDDKFYIIPGADNNFTVDASFTFQYEGEKINPDITWSVESGAEYVECTKNGEIIGTFHIKAKPATGTVITIKATDSVNNLEKTIKIVINELTSFDLDCSDIKDGDKVKLHAGGNTIYVAYDLTAGSFTLTPTDFKGVDNAPVPPSSVTWSTSDTAGEYISIDNGTVTIKKALKDDITITATAAGGKTVTMGIKVDGVKTVDFVDGFFKDLDNDATDNTIEYTYTNGGNKSFTLAIKDDGITSKIPGSGIAYNKNMSLEVIAADSTKGETTVLTKDGDYTIKFVDNGSGVVEGKQRIEITVGNLTETFTVTVVDNSSSPFDTKYIFDGEGTANDIKIGEKYLFRVGNGNAIKLSSLFTCANPGSSVDVTVVTDDYVESNLTCTVTADASNWENTTLKFIGTGIASITITNGSNTKTLLVEVVNGVNVASASDSFGGENVNTVLLTNLTLTSGKSISKGTLYGNGFTISAPSFYGNRKAILTLSNANIDNVLIIGATYSEVQYSTGDYFTNAVDAYGTCTISNSYISGCRSAVRLMTGNYVIENSTIDGGIFANIHVDAADSLVLRDVTTVQTLRPATLGNAVGQNVIGLGVYVVNQNAQITIEGDFKQYNWLSEDMISYIRGEVLSKGAQAAMTQTEYKHTINGKQYINTGIVYENVPTNTPVDNRTYAENTTCVRTNVEYAYKVVKETVTYEGIPATVTVAIFSYTNTYTVNSVNVNGVVDRFNYTEGSFVRAQAPIKPKVEITYTANNVENPGNFGSYCQYDEDSNIIKLFVKEGTTFPFSTNFLTATVHNHSLDVSATVQKKVDGAWVDIAWNGTFSDEAGDYRIKFSYSDPYQYDKDGELKDAVTHISYVDILLTVLVPEAQAPTFNFDDKGTGSTSSIVIGDYTYVMPAANTYTITVGGQKINYIVVDGTKESRTKTTTGGDLYRYYHILPKNQLVITEPDLNKTYNYQTTAMPSNLRGVAYTTIEGSASTKTGFKLTVVDSSSPLYYEGTFNISYGSGQDQPASHIVIEYEYIGNNGTTYRYFLGYTFPKQNKSQCVTPETLVTLADGTQKEIQYVTYEDMLLVWNFETGKYDVVPASIVMNHGYDNYIVTSLIFSDGTTVNTINGHGFYDLDNNKFVIIDENNVAKYIGHNFVKQDGDTYTTVALVDYTVKEEYTESWSILTAVHHNAILEGMLTLTPAEVEGSTEYLMPFVVVDMKYDEASMQADIEKYGLYTYEDFAEYIPYEVFEALNLKYFKVSVGKGMITYEEIIYLLNYHFGK